MDILMMNASGFFIRKKNRFLIRMRNLEVLSDVIKESYMDWSTT